MIGLSLHIHVSILPQTPCPSRLAHDTCYIVDSRGLSILNITVCTRPSWGFPGGSVVQNPPAMQELQETWVWSLGWEDPLEKGMATQSSILVWRIPWTGEPGGVQSMGSQRVRHDWGDLAYKHMHDLPKLPNYLFTPSNHKFVTWVCESLSVL